MYGEQFHGLIDTASNIPLNGESGTYSKEIFLKDFPQFTDTESGVSLIPDGILEMFITSANQTILPGRYFEMWQYAAGLYVAHYSTMYLKTYSEGSTSAAQAAAKGQQAGMVSEATMGDTTVKYDNSAVTAAMAKWGSWNATQYGQQLIPMARMIGMGGSYVI